MEAPAGDALYATMFYEFDPFGNLTKVTDPKGNYSLKHYDAIGQLLREEFYDASGTLLATNGMAYNLGGDVTNRFNALGGATSARYTSAGLPEFQQKPDGSTGSWLYYADGRVRREIQDNGAYWESTYNDAARTVTRIYYSPSNVPLATNSTQMDRRGNTVLRTDADENTFTMAWTVSNLRQVRRLSP